MFLSDADEKAHKRAAARLKKQRLDFEARAARVGNPEQLMQFILEEIRLRYRRGERRIVLDFTVPVVNFIAWAVSTQVITEDEVTYIKQLIRKTLLKQIKNRLRQEVAPNIPVFECTYGGGDSLAFEVQISVLSPR